MDDSIQSLIVYLEKVFCATSETKLTLSACCDEAAGLLNSWEIADVWIGECTCTCQGLAFKTESKLEDVAQGIMQTLETAQKLRETYKGQRCSTSPKLKSQVITSTNPLTVKKYLTCESGSVDGNDQKQKVNSKHNMSRSKAMPTSIRTTPVKIPGDSQVPASSKKTRHIIPLVTRRSYSVGETIVKKRNSPLQTTYQKDFGKILELAKNKKSSCITVKIDSPNLPSQVEFSKKCRIAKQDVLKELNNDTSSSSCLSNISDLNMLLESVSSSQTEEYHTVNCSVHGDFKNQNKFRKVDLVEALDLMGVPSEVVQVSKQYHHYLNHVPQKRGQFASKQFLDSFTNKTQQKLGEPLIEIIVEYLHFLLEINSQSEGNEDPSMKMLQDKMVTLETRLLKWSGIEESVLPPQLSCIKKQNSKDTFENLIVMLDGIWNPRILTGFNSKSEWAYYGPEYKWSCYQRNIQEIQSLDMQIQVLKILTTSVIPILPRNQWNSEIVCLFNTVCKLSSMLSNFDYVMVSYSNTSLK